MSNSQQTYREQNCEVLTDAFEDFVSTLPGDQLRVGVGEQAPPQGDVPEIGTVTTTSFDHQEHDNYDDYLPIDKQFETVIVDVETVGYFQRHGIIIACEQLVKPGGLLVARTRGTDVPAWAKTDMDESSIIEFRIDRQNPWDDAPLITVYRKEQQTLSNWS
jgi:hypothetical protein